MKRRTHRTIGLLAAAASAILAAGVCAAQDPPAAPSKETREKMAAAHEKMAVCLRSSKDIADCRAQMHQSCQSLGEHACPMMGMGRGMQGPPNKPPAN